MARTVLDSDLDVRHKFALSWIYEVPKAKVENKFLGALLNGYQIGSVFLAQSGQPVTLQSGIDSNGNGDTAGDRAVSESSGSGTPDQMYSRFARPRQARPPAQR